MDGLSFGDNDEIGRPNLHRGLIDGPKLARPVLDRLSSAFQSEIEATVSTYSHYRSRQETSLTHAFLTAFERAAVTTQNMFPGLTLRTHTSNSDGPDSEENKWGLDFGVIVKITDPEGEASAVRGLICQAKRHIYRSRECLPPTPLLKLQEQCHKMSRVTRDSAYGVLYLGEAPWVVFETISAVNSRCLPTLPFKPFSELIVKLLAGTTGDSSIDSVDHECFRRAAKVLDIAASVGA